MYYVILPAEMLDNVLPEQIKQYCNYDKDYTLKEAAFISKELEDGNWLVSCKLSNYKYIENHCVENEMDEIDLEMAKAFYGEENLLTEEQIQGLKFKDELI
jgi:hypothetical protein